MQKLRIPIHETMPRGKPEKDKILALMLYLSGLSMNATAKIYGRNAPLFSKKLKDYGSGKLLIIEAKTSSGGILDILIQKS